MLRFRRRSKGFVKEAKQDTRDRSRSQEGRQSGILLLRKENETDTVGIARYVAVMDATSAVSSALSRTKRHLSLQTTTTLNSLCVYLLYYCLSTLLLL